MEHGTRNSSPCNSSVKTPDKGCDNFLYLGFCAMDFLTNVDWVAVVNILTAAVTLASVIAAVIPGQADDNIVAAIKKVVDILAVNVAHAKAPAVSDEPEDTSKGK